MSADMGFKLGILRTFGDEHVRYVKACDELLLDYDVVDFMGPDWLKAVQARPYDAFLVRPDCMYQERKSMMDERLYLLHKVMGRFIYPSFDELLIYENKRATADWLELHGYPHPRTHVFSRKADALEHIARCDLPVVFKANIGASATQVRIVRSRLAARVIVEAAFGPLHAALSLGAVGYHFKGVPLPFFGKAQKHHVIVQEYVPVKWEWRIIRIGGSYFGHQKLLKGQYASGSGRVGWVAPPRELLLLAKDLCDRGGFYSMALDVFETTDGRYLINELQSLFGSYDDSQMYIDGVPGRFVLKDDEFVFEAGRWNRFGSYLLRVEHVLELLTARAALGPPPAGGSPRSGG
jgi:glutathione synthase/RimK-type ligase-like ATP-grasp enzyme